MAHATSENTSAAALDAGWVDLAGGRWAAALACFERAAASEENAEAHEGLSWAAWWLDDADVVFAARAPRTVSTSNVATGRQRRAWRRGWHVTSSTSTAHSRWRAAGSAAPGRLLGELEPGQEDGWLAFFEGYIASGAAASGAGASGG